MNRLLFIFLCLFIIHPATAQLDSLLDSDPTLEELMNMEVVSASRSAEKVSQAPANIIVVTAKQIEDRGYRTLEEIMKDVAGFDFSVGQPAGEYPTHFLFRGIGDVGQTKFALLVDGIVQNDISNGWMRNVGFNFTMNDIERVEIVSGPGSALYGAFSYSGFINVITKKEDKRREEPLYVKAQMSYGSHQTMAPELFAAYRFESGLNLHLAGRLMVSDGDGGVNRYDPGNYFRNNFEPDSVLTTEYGNVSNTTNGTTLALADGFNNSLRDYYVRGKLTKDGFEAGFNFWNRREGLGSEVVGYEYFTNTDGLDYQAHHDGAMAYFQHILDGDRVNNNARLYYRTNGILPNTGFYYTYQYQSVEGDTFSVADKKKSYSGHGYIIGFEDQLTIELSEKNTFLVGFLGEQKIREYFGISIGDPQDQSNTIVNSTFPSGETTTNPVYFSKYGAVYLQDELYIADPLILTLGFRYDMDEFYGNILNPRAALVYVPESGFNFKAMYGQAFKPPTIFELQDEWRGNIDLLPEVVQTTELELGYVIPKWASIKANIFYNNLTNLIVVAANPNPDEVPIGESGQKATYYQNIGSTNVSGASLRADVFFNKNFSMYANYQYLRGRDGEELDNVAAHKANFGLNYLVWRKLNINLRGNYVGRTKAPITNNYFHPKTPESIAAVGYDYVTEESPDGYSDGFLLFNLTLTGRNLLKGKKYDLQPQLIVRNLLDEQYFQMGRQSGSGTRPVDEVQSSIQNPIGFIPAYHPQPGREVFLGLKFSF